MKNNLCIPPGSTRLPDTAQWQFRFEVKSGSSDRIYIVSQNKAARYWACSCPGWKAYKKCKHLTELSLPNERVPYEVELNDAGGAAKRGFLDGYKRYDTKAEGYGRPEQWRRDFQSATGDAAGARSNNDAASGANMILARRRVIRDDGEDE